MLTGSISLSPSAGVKTSAEAIVAATAHENLIFHPVTFSGFDGGFYMNNALPYTPDDFYFHDVSNDIFVLLWGTVYNRAELVRQYDITRHLSDAELIARLFISEGPDFVKRLNGDFVFLIGQPQKRHWWLYRDHLGIRPVAYFYDKQNLSFSSDIIGLCRALSEGEAIDSDFLLGYFKFIDFRKTPFHKVQKLLPGHYLHFSDEATETVKYWEPEKIKVDHHLQYYQMLSDLKRLLCDAVKIRCDCRFNAGAHVSSGLDSGIVSTLAREEYLQQHDFYGFSWSPRDYTPADVKFDEREIVIAQCKKTKIHPVFSALDADGFNTIISSYYTNLGYFFEDKTAE